MFVQAPTNADSPKMAPVLQNGYTRLVRHAVFCKAGCFAHRYLAGVQVECDVGRELAERALVDEARVRLGG